MDFILDGFQRLFEMLQAQLINIPTNNPLSWVYVLMNAVLIVLALFFGSGNSGGTNIFPW